MPVDSTITTTDPDHRRSQSPDRTFHGKLDLTSFAYPAGSCPRSNAAPSSPVPSPRRRRRQPQPSNPDDDEPKPKRHRRRRRSSSNNSSSASSSSATTPIASNLSDTCPPDLILLFVGVNPSPETARTGHAYAHPTNRYWTLLHRGGIASGPACGCVRGSSGTNSRSKSNPNPSSSSHSSSSSSSSSSTSRSRHPHTHPLPPSATYALPRLYALGNTNIVARPTRNASRLSRAELAAGAREVLAKIRSARPEAICCVGKGVWEALLEGGMEGDLLRVRMGSGSGVDGGGLGGRDGRRGGGNGSRGRGREFRYGWQAEWVMLESGSEPESESGQLPGHGQKKDPDNNHDSNQNPGTKSNSHNQTTPTPWPGCPIFVATTTSGLAAGTSPAEKEAIWGELGAWVRARRRARAPAGMAGCADLLPEPREEGEGEKEDEEEERGKGS